MLRADIKVEGIVQGVGFRPFCYRTANRLGLTGSVKNTGDAGVRITLEGSESSIERFLHTLEERNPPISQIDNVTVRWKDAHPLHERFSILKSDKSRSGKASTIPPDIGLCDECHEEMMDPEDRRYLYPFISCVNCGPRFSVIEKLPYDRERTSMEDFPLCEKCREEYEDPMNRRYHAESTCCSNQGPRMSLYNSERTELNIQNPVREGASLLDEGKIIAIKGIGGIHISTSTSNDSVLKKIRKKFRRPQQPLAIMSKNLETVESFAHVSKEERETLSSWRRPVVLLRKKDKFCLSDLISPGLDTVGVMLAYSGIHHQLFHFGKEPAYVMTSANLPGLPMITKNSEIMDRLSDEIDYFLLHNRQIVNRCDDSVVRINSGKPAFIRRSRGYVPEPIDTGKENERCILALGAEQDNTISMSKDGRIFTSQYLGDIDNPESLDYLKRTVERLSDFLDISKPDSVICDLHPDFSTTELAFEIAEKTCAEPTQIQHHFAHTYALMAEKKIDELIGISADGFGYGLNGEMWGGEILKASNKKVSKIGGLKNYPLPGGDLATEHPVRSVAGILWNRYEIEKIKLVLEGFCRKWIGNGELEIIIKQIQNNLNAPPSSSTGRVLDAISCLLGICGKRTYKGEPALKLEALANKGNPNLVDLELDIEIDKGERLIDPGQLISGVIEELKRGKRKKDIAAAAQETLAAKLATVAIKEAQAKDIENIGITGGVFYNDSMTKTCRKTVEGENRKFVRHEKIPTGDGGVSVGQVFSEMITG